MRSFNSLSLYIWVFILIAPSETDLNRDETRLLKIFDCREMRRTFRIFPSGISRSIGKDDTTSKRHVWQAFGCRKFRFSMLKRK